MLQKQVESAATNAVTDYTKRSLDGPLRESTVARLLVDGKLPPEPGHVMSSDDPVDLSSKSRLLSSHVTQMSTHAQSPPRHPLIKPEPMENAVPDASVEVLRRNMSKEMEMLRNDCVTGTDRGEISWKCHYCPYMAPNSTTLYSHYQFHQQLLTSQCK